VAGVWGKGTGRWTHGPCGKLHEHTEKKPNLPRECWGDKRGRYRPLFLAWGRRGEEVSGKRGIWATEEIGENGSKGGVPWRIEVFLRIHREPDRMVGKKTSQETGFVNWVLCEKLLFRVRLNSGMVFVKGASKTMRA